MLVWSSYKVNNGKNTRFWKDVWIGGCPLKSRIPHIFEICNQQEASIFEVLANNELFLTFRRTFGQLEVEEWLDLLREVENVNLNEEVDTVNWALKKSGNFTATSFYRFLSSFQTMC